MNHYDDLIAALSPVSATLSRFGIRHYIGGSVASSYHGAARSTMDVDLVADITDSVVSGFVRCFDKDFYVSEAAVREEKSTPLSITNRSPQSPKEEVVVTHPEI